MVEWPESTLPIGGWQCRGVPRWCESRDCHNGRRPTDIWDKESPRCRAAGGCPGRNAYGWRAAADGRRPSQRSHTGDTSRRSRRPFSGAWTTNRRKATGWWTSAHVVRWCGWTVCSRSEKTRRISRTRSSFASTSSSVGVTARARRVEINGKDTNGQGQKTNNGITELRRHG